jgi:phenylalanyl-tRNA synthetase beta chain
MGTYDLDTLIPNFTYDAVPPEQIHFVPLNRTTEVDGNQMMELLESDLKLKKFLPIIRDSSVYPVLRDKRGVVLSVPPIINGNSSKITLETRNIFVDVTGTDAHKVNIALNMLVTTFARYCEQPESVEAVKIIYPDGRQIITPDLSNRDEAVSVAYINRSLGLQLSAEQICALLKKMMLKVEPVNAEFVRVAVSPIRSDIIHACDVMEDVAIAYGFNKIPSRIPPTSCIAAPYPLNKLTDLLRREVALTGFTEVLTFSLCSHAENYSMLNKVDPGNEAVVLSNPKTIEFEVAHTSLIPAMLKTLASNKKMALPIRIFQVADVVLQDKQHEVGARNERRLCAIFCGMTSGLEVIHGLLDRVMLMMNIPLTAPGSTTGYYILPSNLPTFFPGRQAEVYINGKVVGAFGIIHPEVSTNFDAPYVSSLLEINIEPIL